MVLNKFRHISDRLIEKPVNWCVERDISPNTITFLGFIVSCIAAVGYALPDIFIYRWYLGGFPVVLFFLAGALDVLDGGVARKTGSASKFGGFLDSTLDRLSDAVIILGLMLGEMLWLNNRIINDLLGFIAISIMILISYTRSRAELEGVVMKGVGLMERAERVFLIMFGYIIESWINMGEITEIGPFSSSNPYNGGFFPIFFLVFIGLCVETLIVRIRHSYKWLSGTVSTKYLEKHELTELYEQFKKENKIQGEKKSKDTPEKEEDS